MKMRMEALIQKPEAGPHSNESANSYEACVKEACAEAKEEYGRPKDSCEAKGEDSFASSLHPFAFEGG
jgi:hypothetical protein